MTEEEIDRLKIEWCDEPPRIAQGAVVTLLLNHPTSLPTEHTPHFMIATGPAPTYRSDRLSFQWTFANNGTLFVKTGASCIPLRLRIEFHRRDDGLMCAQGCFFYQGEWVGEGPVPVVDAFQIGVLPTRVWK